MKNITVADLAPLIEENKGNIAAVARRLGVSRGTIHNRINDSPTLKQALADARETMLDNAESVLYKKVLEGSTPELLFFLKTQGRNRGYVERQELDHSGEIQTKHIFDHAAVAASVATGSGRYRDPSGADESGGDGATVG